MTIPCHCSLTAAVGVVLLFPWRLQTHLCLVCANRRSWRQYDYCAGRCQCAWSLCWGACACTRWYPIPPPPPSSPPFFSSSLLLLLLPSSPPPFFYFSFSSSLNPPPLLILFFSLCVSLGSGRPRGVSHGASFSVTITWRHTETYRSTPDGAALHGCLRLYLLKRMDAPM